MPFPSYQHKLTEQMAISVWLSLIQCLTQLPYPIFQHAVALVAITLLSTYPLLGSRYSLCRTQSCAGCWLSSGSGKGINNLEILSGSVQCQQEDRKKNGFIHGSCILAKILAGIHQDLTWKYTFPMPKDTHILRC